MSKYPCDLIEDLIPLYIEEDISSVTKKIVEEHIKECKKCSLLVQEYWDSELVLEDLQKDLPQANTFKKWMKKLRLWGGIAGIVILVAVITTGVFGYKIGERSKNNLLTLRKVVRTLKAEGLALKEANSKTPDDYVLNGIKPVIYRIGESNDTLLIYVFKSFGEKNEILSKVDKYNIPFQFEERPYHAKNTLIVYKPAKFPKTKEDLKKIAKTTSLISDIVFEKLNEGKVRVYHGESQSWEGFLTLKYYQHWFEEDGKLYYDSFYEKSPALQYKKSDIANVGPLTFEYKAGSSRGSSEGYSLNEKGYVKLGSSGGSGAILSEDAEVRFTVKWGEQEEHFILKAK